MTTRYKPEVGWNELQGCFEVSVFDTETSANAPLRPNGDLRIFCADPSIAWELAAERAAQLEESYGMWRMRPQSPTPEQRDTLDEIAECIEEAQAILLRLKLLTSEA